MGSLRTWPSSVALRPILGRIHLEWSATEIFSVELLDGLGRLGVTRELDEGEASRSARLPIGGDMHVDDLACLGQKLGELILRGAKIEITDKHSG